jgi:hypothetical protein
MDSEKTCKSCLWRKGLKKRTDWGYCIDGNLTRLLPPGSDNSVFDCNNHASNVLKIINKALTTKVLDGKISL